MTSEVLELTLYGEEGDSGERKLQKSQTHMNKFERGQEDVFRIEAANLGRLEKSKFVTTVAVSRNRGISIESSSQNKRQRTMTSSPTKKSTRLLLQELVCKGQRSLRDDRKNTDSR